MTIVTLLFLFFILNQKIKKSKNLHNLLNKRLQIKKG